MHINISSYLTILFCTLSGHIVHATKSGAQPGEQTFLSGLDIWNIIAVALSVIACLISIIARKPKKRRRSSSPFSNQTQAQGNSSQDVYNPLSDELKTMQDDFKMQLDKIQRQLTSHINDAYEKLPETNNYVSRLPQSSSAIKYAKTADGNAFAIDALSDIQDNKKIYELTIQSADTGTFRVTSNKEAQLFALEDPNNYLRGACNYRSLPTYNSTIVTDTPGRLERSGDKWLIVTPAEIDFS